VGLSSSPTRQPTLPHDDDFPGTIIQPLRSHQGFGGGGGSDPGDSGDEGFNSDEDDDEDDMDDDSSPDDEEEVSKSKDNLKKKNLMIKQKNGRSGSVLIVLSRIHWNLLLRLFIV
jgi:hypothetical protein